MKKVLMVLTSHQHLENTDSKTGVWLGEFTEPYYTFLDNGFIVVLASPAGGEPPVDPMSKLVEHITASNRRFHEDPDAQRLFSNTLMLDTLEADSFDALFYPGGHGPLWDLARNAISGKLILDFLSAGKPVGTVCHGPAALLKAAALQPGLLRGKRITAFTNAEEMLTGRMDHIPYQLESALKELGADFHSATVPFTTHVETDGLLITGQNPLSSGPTARAVIQLLGAVGELGRVDPLP
ncbi:type 1 glutamine amidotransferase domain-containing protein [Parapedobacter koreensis]|uniref:Putative intracellular protease/amidase n=1 Tax=Parapedobacter koreensis TaxID=332977 RepID=A0A1H7MZR0_9SPHI|nr:type 1 glutamine amidotransferase domain-containing protein [Parapedobacter koreensis]SEL16674.1 Putative intracellular protease/amidase [Parapedobacter koreensis]